MPSACRAGPARGRNAHSFRGAGSYGFAFRMQTDSQLVVFKPLYKQGHERCYGTTTMQAWIHVLHKNR